MTIVRVRFTPNGVPTPGKASFVARHDEDNRPIVSGRDILSGNAEWEDVPVEGKDIDVRPQDAGWHYVVRVKADGHPQQTTTVLVPPNGPVNFGDLVRYDPKAGMAYEPDPDWWAWVRKVADRKGVPGDDGASAYQVAVRNGYAGTEQEWLNSLEGTPGDEGTDGKTAYQVAVANGFVGTEQEWVDSLAGAPGEDGGDGRSAYQVAVDNGFVGSEAAWLDSLVGPEGPMPTELATSTTDGLMPATDKAALDGATPLPEPEALVIRDSSGRIYIEPPEDPAHPTNRGYVDGEIIGVLQDNQTAEGDWTFSRGVTTEEARAKLGVARDYTTDNGDLFNGTARVEISLRAQQATSQNPPGYSMGTISLIENGENGAQYQGESARMALISNRILFNRRLEVDMGGSGRATLRAGTAPGEQYARMSLHNASYPRLDLSGVDHSGTYKDTVLVDRGTLVVVPVPGSTTTQMWDNRDSSDIRQQLHVSQFGAGHQTIRAFHDGVVGGQVSFQPSDGSLRLRGANGGVHLNSKVTATEDIELSAGKNVIAYSPNGTRYRITVSNTGALSAEAA